MRASEAMRAGIEALSPTHTSATGVRGPRTRSTAALPTREMAAPAVMLPTPAMTGTRPRSRASSPSSSENAVWMLGMRVTRAAKHTPCAA